ncbi:MAG: FtsX-like permease family protein, partial [Acidobacteria bacterium]|nr:FtsX-like permease family protein [Acidobacteriota bacterium]
LLLTSNLQRFVEQWMDAAEVSVFLRDDVDDDRRGAIEAIIRRQPTVERVDFVAKDDAMARFRTDFPELADVTTTIGENPFPASFEVRLRPGAGVADDAAALASVMLGEDGVADVQFDRRWLERVLALIAGARVAGLVVTVVLLLGAAFTVTAVVRLSLHARRDELDIMRLVGAPLAFIRGPFVVEGLLLGGIGAVVAIVVLGIGFGSVRGWLGADGLTLTAGQEVLFLSWRDQVLLVAAGLGVGALAGFIASRSAR